MAHGELKTAAAFLEDIEDDDDVERIVNAIEELQRDLEKLLFDRIGKQLIQEYEADMGIAPADDNDDNENLEQQAAAGLAALFG